MAASKAGGSKVGNPTEDDEGDIYYEMEAEWRRAGICVIINNVHFRDQSTREGSELDGRKLRETFDAFGYKILEHVNLTSSQISEKLVDVRDKYFVEKSKIKRCSLVVCILSHGDEGVVVGSDDEEVDQDSIYAIFHNDKCLPLRDKPRIFIFQSCRGEKLLGTVPNLLGGYCGTSRDQKPPSVILPRISDYIIVHATVKGYAAFRYPETGSPFIQTLCAELHERGHNTDILRVLTSVNRRVSGMPYTIRDERGEEIMSFVMMPEICFTLRKLIRFKRQ